MSDNNCKNFRDRLDSLTKEEDELEKQWQESRKIKNLNEKVVKQRDILDKSEKNWNKKKLIMIQMDVHGCWK